MIPQRKVVNARCNCSSGCRKAAIPKPTGCRQSKRGYQLGFGSCCLRQHNRACMASHRSTQWVRARGRFQGRARRTRATLQFFSCAAPCPRKRRRGISRKTPPLWCTSFPIVPACLDGTIKFSMRVSINNFIGPIDFFSLLVGF